MAKVTDYQASLTVASFNVHAGVDGRGRPFDVIAACRALEADVLVLQETWTPQGRPGTAATVARSLGYHVVEHPLAGGRLARPGPGSGGGRKESFDWRRPSQPILLDSERPLSPKVRHSRRYLEAEPGRWGVAVLSRLPVRDHTLIDLGRLEQDPARRAALVVGVEVGGAPMTIIGTHMSHLTYGAPVQFMRLRRAIRGLELPDAAVLAGDMNLWGPPVVVLLPGWRRAVRDRTWPAWRPHSQVDHILVRGSVKVEQGQVCDFVGSDHLPVRAHLRL